MARGEGEGNIKETGKGMWLWGMGRKGEDTVLRWPEVADCFKKALNESESTNNRLSK